MDITKINKKFKNLIQKHNLKVESLNNSHGTQ